MGRDFHPNLIPVDCKDQNDIAELAEVMRAVCLRNVQTVEEYQGSETVEAAIETAKEIVPDMLDSGELRFIRYIPDGRVVNVVFTLQEKETKAEWIWNLSISHGTETGPKRVDDDLAFMIARAYLEEFEEVYPKSVWKEVRHFIKIAK